ncbi:MAG: carboxylating nicotinate-nucleotide diphosphorylase [Candidatus Eremiobacteraeota bacterium]|nr:carboxylating nicotinate-nucleotide diphosphorylase [Candidatus Eremiobacteraeota bacterium]
MIWQLQWESMVKTALLEDLGGMGDVTTEAIVPVSHRSQAAIVARQAGVMAGSAVVVEVFRQLDPELRVEVKVADGESFVRDKRLIDLEGSSRAILVGERTALNFLARACAIATQTRRVVEAIAGTGARVVATRKTTPGLRLLEKHAVEMGGGLPHRFGLDDAILIKDNHVAVAGGVVEALRRARSRAGHMLKIEVEVDTLEQLAEVLPLEPDVVLLDNMAPAGLRRAVEMVAGRCPTEASGGITLETARQVAESGVNYLSLGSLTHSVSACDLSMEFSTKTDGSAILADEHVGSLRLEQPVPTSL